MSESSWTEDLEKAARRRTGGEAGGSGVRRWETGDADRRRQADGVKYDLETFRGDLFGSLTATVVALPVALALGVASGMGAVAGLHGAIAVGFFAAVFGGTRSQISGPTAPMTVAMTVILTTHASNLTEALTVVVLGGLLQMLLGAAKLGRYVVYTPYVVISGFMSGIGIIVILIQILPFLGSPPASGGAVGAMRALPDASAAATAQRSTAAKSEGNVMQPCTTV